MLFASHHYESGFLRGNMSRFFTLLGIVCLIIGFQNCSPSAVQLADNSSTDISVFVPGVSADGSLSNSNKTVSKVTFVEIPNIAMDEASVRAKSSVPSSDRLVISLQSGSVHLLDEKNEVLEKRCLNSSQLQELKTILGGSSVCAIKATKADVCGQRYKAGYAALYADDDRINLGEEMDSCGNGKKDLCGSLGEVFQNYISFVRQNWTGMACE